MLFLYTRRLRLDSQFISRYFRVSRLFLSETPNVMDREMRGWFALEDLTTDPFICDHAVCFNLSHSYILNSPETQVCFV
jgi:hypothetical protein